VGGLGWGVLSVGLCFCPLVYVFVRWCVYIFRRREIHGALTLLQAPRFYRARRVVACHPRVLRFQPDEFEDLAEIYTFCNFCEAVKPVVLYSKQILRQVGQLGPASLSAKPPSSPQRHGRESHAPRQAAARKQTALQTTKVVNW
jgi:hypothetical protein